MKTEKSEKYYYSFTQWKNEYLTELVRESNEESSTEKRSKVVTIDLIKKSLDCLDKRK